jgi:hypothetical protein
LTPYPPTDPQKEAEAKAREAEQNARTEKRKHAHPFVGAGMTVAFTERSTQWQQVAVGPTIFAGVRTHFTRRLGIEGRVAASFLSTNASVCTSTSYRSGSEYESCDNWHQVASSSGLDLAVMGGLIIGPFGPFYMVAPEVIIEHPFQSNSAFREETIAGMAFRSGFNLTKAEDLSLWGTMGITKHPGSDEPRFRFEIAMSYSF